MWLFLLFLAVPLIEIGLFIKVGGLIGLWPTLGIVILTAVLGTALVRSQGAQALNQLRRSFEDLRDPSEPLAHGAMILLSGALLLTPGFFTDACGLLLLIPAVRKAIIKHFKSRVTVESFHYGMYEPRERNDEVVDGDVIDADYEDITKPPRPTHRPSGWTKH